MGKRSRKQLQKELEATRAALARSYDAAKITRFRKQPIKSQSGDAAVNLEAGRLRAWARHLDENLDIASGIITTLVNNTVGCGTNPVPMVMQRNGKLAERLNKQITEAWAEWQEHPEVTGEMTWAEAERMACRTYFRDGEVLCQHVMGAGIEHLGGLPYSIELIESDLLPYELNEPDNRILHGVEKDQWGRPIAYFLYEVHPGDIGNGLLGVIIPTTQNTRRVPAENLLHVKFTRRIRQTRGVTCLHSVITRLDDIKDFEESERIKARIQAAFSGAITKSTDVATTTADLNPDGDRSFEMASGMIFDGLMPGESIVPIESTSPTALLKDYRAEMLRAAAAGTETNYSSISKDYNGTYSAQRQEMVESKPSYKRLREYFLSAFTKPIYRKFIDMAMLTGRISVPRSLVGPGLYAADFGQIATPWIDPKKEIEAWAIAVENGFKSRQQIIRMSGDDPHMVDKQREEDTMPAEQPAAEQEQQPPADDEQDDEQQENAA